MSSGMIHSNTLQGLVDQLYPTQEETALSQIVNETLAQYEVRSQKEEQERLAAKTLTAQQPRVQPIYRLLEEDIVKFEIEPGKFIFVGEETTTQCCWAGCPCPPCMENHCESCCGKRL